MNKRQVPIPKSLQVKFRWRASLKRDGATVETWNEFSFMPVYVRLCTSALLNILFGVFFLTSDSILRTLDIKPVCRGDLPCKMSRMLEIISVRVWPFSLDLLIC